MRQKCLTASVSNSQLSSTKKQKALRQNSPCEISDQNIKLLALAEEVAHFGSWALDLSQTEAIWSPGMFRVFGIEPRTAGFSWEEYVGFIHPDDLDSANKNVDVMLHSL